MQEWNQLSHDIINQPIIIIDNFKESVLFVVLHSQTFFQRAFGTRSAGKGSGYAIVSRGHFSAGAYQLEIISARIESKSRC